MVTHTKTRSTVAAKVRKRPGTAAPAAIADGRKVVKLRGLKLSCTVSDEERQRTGHEIRTRRGEEGERSRRWRTAERRLETLFAGQA